MPRIRIFLIIGFVIVAILAFFYATGNYDVVRTDFAPILAPHYYKDSSISIATINLDVFYFVPSDKMPYDFDALKRALDAELPHLIAFHEGQLLQSSRIIYRIFPRPIIADEPQFFYDTDITRHGNPEGLRKIREEIMKKVYAPNGDYSNPAFSVGASEYAFHSMLVIYEGIGASGADMIALVGRTFITDDAYQDFAPTFIAHEFYHALGVPDHYIVTAKTFPDGASIPTEILTEEDIMGRVRIPIERAYIERMTLHHLGINL